MVRPRPAAGGPLEPAPRRILAQPHCTCSMRAAPATRCTGDGAMKMVPGFCLRRLGYFLPCVVWIRSYNRRWLMVRIAGTAGTAGIARWQTWRQAAAALQHAQLQAGAAGTVRGLGKSANDVPPAPPPRKYSPSLSTAQNDVLAGLSVGAMVLPQGMCVSLSSAWRAVPRCVAPMRALLVWGAWPLAGAARCLLAFNAPTGARKQERQTRWLCRSYAGLAGLPSVYGERAPTAAASLSADSASSSRVRGRLRQHRQPAAPLG